MIYCRGKSGLEISIDTWGKVSCEDKTQKNFFQMLVDSYTRLQYSPNMGYINRSFFNIVLEPNGFKIVQDIPEREEA